MRIAGSCPTNRGFPLRVQQAESMSSKVRRSSARRTAIGAAVQEEVGNPGEVAASAVPGEGAPAPEAVLDGPPNLAVVPAPAKKRKTRAAMGEPKPLVVVEADALEGEDEAARAARKNLVEVRVRRLHRRDINRTWEFLKLVFRDVNRETVEYQRPRSKNRFMDVYEEKGEQLLFEVGDQIVGYAECAFDASGADNWINPRYFEKRGMRPLYVEELAVHPDYQGKGVGGFVLDQLQHLARVRGCTHLVLEVAENNEGALSWYRKRNFYKLDAAIFMAQKIPAEPELLPPRRLPGRAKTVGKGKARKPSAGTRKAPRPSGASKATRRK